jgi:hypothetical protein
MKPPNENSGLSTAASHVAPAKEPADDVRGGVKTKGGRRGLSKSDAEAVVRALNRFEVREATR